MRFAITGGAALFLIALLGQAQTAQEWKLDLSQYGLVKAGCFGYPGHLEFLDDDLASADLHDRERAIAGYEQCRKLASEAPLSAEELQNPALSFVLAEPVLDVGLRQTILSARSEAERMKCLADYFPKYLARELHVQKLKSVAPRNGHGKSGPTIH